MKHYRWSRLWYSQPSTRSTSDESELCDRHLRARSCQPGECWVVCENRFPGLGLGIEKRSLELGVGVMGVVDAVGLRGSSSSNQSLMAPKSIFQTFPVDGSVSTMSLCSLLAKSVRQCKQHRSWQELYISTCPSSLNLSRS